ncbi:MAG: signal peptidase II [bacterium]
MRKLPSLLSLVIAGVVLAIDQLTKLAITHNLEFFERTPLFGNAVRFTYIRNTGAVFGLMKGAGTYFTFFSIVAAIVLFVVLFYARRSSTAVRISLGLVLGGAIGNLIDRFRYGAVVDFIDIGIRENLRWPCFNAADAAITIGVFVLIIFSLTSSRPRSVEIESDEKV